MNVIEVYLKQLRWLKSISIDTIGAYPAPGVVGISLLGGISKKALETLTPEVMQWAEYQPRLLFGFDSRQTATEGKTTLLSSTPRPEKNC